MKVKDKDRLGNSIELDLNVALQPIHYCEAGVAEMAHSQAEANARAIGELAGLLVEKGILTLAEAADACGNYDLEAIE